MPKANSAPHLVFFCCCFFMNNHNAKDENGFKPTQRNYSNQFLFYNLVFLKEGCTGALQVAIVPATLRCFCAYGGLWFILCVLFYVLENTEQSLVCFRSLIYDKLT